MDEYILRVRELPEDEVKWLLRKFLMESGGIGHDLFILENLQREPAMLVKAIENFEFIKRLVGGRHPWEGNTWVLDLLPHAPHEAYAGLSAYFTAHVQFLPDGRWTGFTDALSIIRARYFEYEHQEDRVMELNPTDFEHLIGSLFNKIGYETEITGRTRDGGFDLMLTDPKEGRLQKALVECKRRIDRFGVEPIRQLAGVLGNSRANKAFFVSCGSYTQPAHKFAMANRIELIGWKSLNRLMNEYFGQNWPIHVDFHIGEHKRTSSLKSQTQ